MIRFRAPASAAPTAADPSALLPFHGRFVPPSRGAVASFARVVHAFARREAPDRQLSSILAEVRAALGLDVAVLLECEPADGSFGVVQFSGSELAGLRLGPECLAGTVTRHRRGEVVPDLSRDPRRAELGEAVRIRRTLCVPVDAGDGPVGALLAGSTSREGSSPDDAHDIAVLTVFGEMAAHAWRAERERVAEVRRHDRLAALAAAMRDRRLGGTDLDEALGAIATRRGMRLERESGPDPLLPEVCAATGAAAAAMAVLGTDGCFRIADAWNLPPSLVGTWSQSTASAREGQEPGRLARIVPAEGAGFRGFRDDLRVIVPSHSEGERILHVLSAPERAPFGPMDVRCAEVAAIHLAGVADWRAARGRLEPVDELPDLGEEALELVLDAVQDTEP